jgi:creatinine amidohydrolase
MIKNLLHAKQLDEAAPQADRRRLAVVPLGAMETHGPHLPLGTDAIIAERFLDLALARDEIADIEVFRLPTIWLGASAEHRHGRGTLSLEPEQFVDTLVAVGDGLAHAGFDRLLMVNAHGGNVAAIQIAALKLRERHRLLAAFVHWADFGFPAEMDAPGDPRHDVHGGWLETSIMLDLAPELVDRSQLAPSPASPPAASLYPLGPVSWGWMTGDMASAGEGQSEASTWIGRPDLASAEIGRRIAAHVSESLAAAIRDLAQAGWTPAGPAHR